MLNMMETETALKSCAPRQVEFQGSLWAPCSAHDLAKIDLKLLILQVQHYPVAEGQEEFLKKFSQQPKVGVLRYPTSFGGHATYLECRRSTASLSFGVGRRSLDDSHYHPAKYFDSFCCMMHEKNCYQGATS